MTFTLPDRLLANSAEAMPLVTLTSAIASVLTPLMVFQFVYKPNEGSSVTPLLLVPSTVKVKPAEGRPFREGAPDVPLALATIPVPSVKRAVQSRFGSGSSLTCVVLSAWRCSELAYRELG